MISSSEERELRELRDAVNNTRALVRGLQKQARAGVALLHDLEERLEAFDSRIHRQAQEAQHEQNNQHHQLARQ